jgi:ATP/maltotriose-dependent transcriptional regulator MalT
VALLEAAVLVEDRRAADLLIGRLARVESSLDGSTGSLSCAARHLGAAAALLGEPDRARAFFQRALDICTGISFRPEAALTCLALAEIVLKHYPHERVAGLAHLDFAIAEFEQMKMQPALERALAVRPGQRRTHAVAAHPAFPDGLSEREVEVLRLIAAGKSNAEIAAQLVLSVHTVIRHANHIFAKLGVANRTEAAAYAHRTGLAGSSVR